MTSFEELFNGASIYEMLFLNVKGALIYQTTKNLKEENRELFENWKYIMKFNQFRDYHDDEEFEMLYKKHAPYYSEYCKIIGITYATLYIENGTLKRYIKKIINDDEAIIVEQFFDILHQISNDGVASQPNFFPILCGYGITNFDIPLLIKRFLVYRNKFNTNKKIPYILKRSLNIKPWESGILDIANIWKFNGNNSAPLQVIANSLGLKKTTDLLLPEELSEYYWNNYKEKPDETSEFISLQSAIQTNLVIQFVNELRHL